MTIVEVLEAQHRDLDAWFDDVNDAADIERARAMFRDLSTKLIARMRAEHAVVYPRIAFGCKLRDEVCHATREHERIEAAVNELRLADMPADEWRVAVCVLQQLVADHHAAEHWSLFSLASIVMSHAELCRIADDYLAFEASSVTTAAASITYEPAPVERAQLLVVTPALGTPALAQSAASASSRAAATTAAT